jgi:hypothetical protein
MGGLVHVHGHYVTRANELIWVLSVDGEFEGDTAVSYVPYARMHVEHFIETGRGVVLAPRLHVEKIHSVVQEVLVAVPDGPHVLQQALIEVDVVVREEDVPLGIRLRIPYLQSMGELELLGRWRIQSS